MSHHPPSRWSIQRILGLGLAVGLGMLIGISAAVLIIINLI